MFSQHITVFLFWGLSFAQVITTQFKKCPTSREPTKNSTCAWISFKVANSTWNSTLNNKSTPYYLKVNSGLPVVVCQVVGKKADNVIIFPVTFERGDEDALLTKAKVCMDFTGEGFIEDLLRGKDFVFEAIGVSFSAWIAKDGECEKCNEGGGGPITLISSCKSKEHSCNGVRNKSKTKKGCVEYCSASSLVTVAVSHLVLAIWISLLFK